MASLRATTACAICQQELEPAAAQRWRCEVCRPDYEVCAPCYLKGVNNHPHILITRPPSTTASVAPNTQTNQIQAAQVYIYIFLYISKLKYVSECIHWFSIFLSY